MKISINHNSHVPLYIQIEEQLRKIIQHEDYKKGKMLPNEVDLSRQLGVSRNTLRQAINNLVSDGLLTRKKGIGTIVANTTICSKARNWKSFTQEMRAMGIEPMNYELQIGWSTPSDEIYNFFNAENTEKLLYLKRLRGDKAHPFVYFISYFNPSIGLQGNEDFSQPLYDILEKRYNTVVRISKEEITAAIADKLIAEKLDMKVGEPILVRKRFVYDQGEHPIEWNIGYYRADSFTYSLEFGRE